MDRRIVAAAEARALGRVLSNETQISECAKEILWISPRWQTVQRRQRGQLFGKALGHV